MSDFALVSVDRIWDRAPHNAFTDLIRYRGRWYCTFREGEAHGSHDGVLRVIASDDGERWESVALFTSPRGFDMREAKFSVTPKGGLMLIGPDANRKTAPSYHQTMVWFSSDGNNWSEPHDVAERNFWLWRVTWHKGKAYGFGYGTHEENRMIRLYVSRDGKIFDTLIENAFDVGYPNETSLVFLPDDTCYCLLRRDGATGSAQLGVAEPPYTKWIWKDLGVRIGGPQAIRLPDGRFAAAVRRSDGSGPRTSLHWLDVGEGTLTEALRLPSGGDTSYAGLVWHQGLLWISYYSSHEEKTSIYLAKIKLP